MSRSILKMTGAGLAVSLMLGVSGAALAQDYPPMPPVGAPKPFNLPTTTTYSLPNGLEVTLIPYGLTPKVAISLQVPTGNIDDGSDTWLSDVTVDMLREGASDRTGPQIAQTAASMGGGLQTSVGMHNAGISLNVLSEHGADAVALLADVARRPTFPESERQRVIEARQRQVAVAQSSAQSQADAALAHALYGDHPYGEMFPTTEQLDGYTLERMKAFHQAQFGPTGAHLYVAGQFDEAAMRAAIEAAFGDWSGGDGATQPQAAAAAGPRVVLIDRPGAPQSTLRVAFQGPAIGGEADIPMRVTDTLLGGSFNSRITRNIREDKGYTYSPSTYLDFKDTRESQWIFDADVTTADTGAALTEVFKEVRRMQDETPSATEAAGSRTYMAGIFILQNATAAGVLGSLAQRDRYGLPDDWLESYVPSVLAVTPEQMSASAKANLPLDKMTLVVVGDLATVRSQLEALPELQGVTFETDGE